MASGGDITEVTFNHPTLGGGVILPKAGEDSTYDLGGIRSADDMQMIDGGGNAIKQMTRGRWSFEVTAAWDMDDDTLKKCVDLSGSPVDADWTITCINGKVYQGSGSPVGDLQGNGNAATFPLKVSGGGVLKQIV